MLLSVSLKTSEAFHIFALLAWILSFKKSYQNQIKVYFLGILKYLNINENREDVHVIFLSLAWICNVICRVLLFIMKMKWESKVMTWNRLRNVAEICVFIFNELTREEIVRFVDIGGFIDHHSLNFFFHKMH
jgi:hypothetical protein